MSSRTASWAPGPTPTQPGPKLARTGNFQEIPGAGGEALIPSPQILGIQDDHHMEILEMTSVHLAMDRPNTVTKLAAPFGLIAAPASAQAG